MAYSFQAKSSAPTYGLASKSAAPTYSLAGRTLTEDFLLMESGDRLLLEIGDFIILEQSVPAETPWSFQSQS